MVKWLGLPLIIKVTVNSNLGELYFAFLFLLYLDHGPKN